MTLRVKTVGLKETRAYMQAVRRGVPQAVFLGVRAASQLYKREVKRELTNRALNVDTGSLRASFTDTVFTSRAGVVRGVVGSPLIYARIHETGGTITPRNAQKLTIPFPRARRTRASDWPGAFIVKRPDGRLFLAQRSGSGLEYLFTLVDSVTMPARRYLTKTTRRTRKRIVALVGGRFGVLIETGKP